MTNDKKPRGGKRPNSGAKPKYGEPTKTIPTRVPESKVGLFRQNAKEFLKQFKVKNEPDWNDEDDFQCCDKCDLPDACADFGCAIKTGVRKEPGL